MTPASLAAVARHYLFVRETLGPNLGYFVQDFQRFTGNEPGSSWCSSFSSKMCDIAYMGNPPLKKSGSSHARLTEARAKGYVVAEPRIDGLGFFVDENGHAHHEFIVTLVTGKVFGIAGNTSEDGMSSNGTGVFEHAVNYPRIVWVELPKNAQV